MPAAPTSPNALFLSYAREDTAAAQRLAEALRSSGIEVWFDQSELRGGDAWDQNIRRQIKECALFLPVISAHTQARGEGYFRLEWKLAAERTHLMAEGVPFLAPVVIDDTAEAAAAVPEQFLRVQWTRLPRGLPTPQFVEQISRLLVQPRTPMMRMEPGRPRPAERAEGGASPLKVGRRVPAAAWVAALAIAGIAIALWKFSLATRNAGAGTRPPTSEKSTPALNDKSIAVLPFANLSEDKDANAFFADGIHEDILTNLAHIRELRVVSRTSVMEYRGKAENLRAIAQKLNVAYILEGSVRRAGGKVRVTGQLIRAATDEHVWAETMDRDLSDVFAIQSELAQKIAASLEAAISPQEKNLLARRPTSNPAAYDLFLKARQLNREGNDTRAEYETEAAMLQSAVAFDPAFAAAWADLASTHAQLRFGGYDASAARLDQARAAMETARRLDPDNPAVIAGTGSFYYYGLRDYPHALEQFERILRQWPNDSSGYLFVGFVQRRQGRWRESFANFRQAEQLDPASPEIARNLVISLRAMRRYDEAVVEQARRVRLLPESLRESFELARLHFLAHGSIRELDELLTGPIAARADAAIVAGYRKSWAATKGDPATAMRLEREFPNEWGETLGNGRFSRWRSAVLGVAAGDGSAARARVEKEPAELRARLASEPENPNVWTGLALIESVLGHPAEALTAARKSLEILPETRDALSGTGGRWGLVCALAWTGDKEAACAELSRLLAEPSNIHVHELKSSPWLAPLKGDPRFEAIINDPKNNAPLF